MRTSNPARSVAAALCAVLVTSLVLACGGGQDGAAPAAAQNKPAPIPSDAKSPAAKLFVTYLGVARALAADDVTQAKRGYGELVTLAQDAAAVADATLRERVASAAKLGADAKDLASARKTFDALTRAMLDVLRSAPNPTSAALRVAHCPMAFDNAGADWLQVGEAIANPYFGSEMYACGSVGADVKPGQKLVAK